MSTYQGIRGLKVRDYTTNPDNPLEGQLWYNKTDKVGKYQIPNVADAWRTSGPLNTGSWSRVTGGSVDSAWAASGEVSGSGFVKINETWNGTTWTEVNDNNISHYAGNGSHGVPNNTTGLVFFGYDPTIPGDHSRTEEWNGTNWTELSDGNTVRRFGGGNGTTAEACLYYGGLTPSTSFTNTELWNGSSWTETTDINNARYGTNGIGSSTSAAYIGGNIYPGPQPPGSFHEQWNGSTWTESTDANQKTHGAGSGIVNTAMVIFGGNPVGYTEIWNGSTWTETTDLNEARNSVGGTGAGGTTSSLCVGGVPPGGQPNGSASVEEFLASQPIGAWTTSTAMNTARYNIGNVGVYNAALGFGGRSPSIANNESWNGSSWTELNDLNTARHSFLGGSGTTTSALAMGGENGGYTNKVEEWNGSSWTETTDLNTTRGEGGGSGASAEAALAFSGTSSSYTQMKTETESWNGSSWTEVADVNTARFQGVSGLGRTYTAALWVAGRNTPGSFLANSEQYNGSTWTETNDINTARLNAAGQTGSSTSAFIAGGNPPYTGKTEDWNGVSWQETSDMNTARGSGSGGAAADITQGLVYGGYTGTAATTATEEWSSTSNSTKTISTD